MADQDVSITLFELDGSTVRQVVDEAHGFVITSWQDSWQWVRETVSSRTVDDEFEINRRRGAGTIQATIQARAVSMAQADYLADALTDAVCSDPFLLARESAGVTRVFRCRVADVVPSFTTEDWINSSDARPNGTDARRSLALSIPCSPHVTTTGTVAP